MSARSGIFLLLLVLLGLLGWFLGHDASGGASAKESHRPDREAFPPPVLHDAPNPPSMSARERRVAREEDLGGIPNERLIHFKDEESYRAFLKSLDGSGLRLLGQLDALRTLRVGYDDYADLSALLNDDTDEFANFAVYIPEPPTESSAGGIGFGSNVLEWLGIRGDNSTLGTGVRIAVVDTGVTGHPSLGSILQIDLLSEIRGPGTEINSHGTSVASLIAGSEGSFSGIAPGAELISVRIGDENGSANSFLLAQGIVRAVDAGAQLINVSMGSDGNSSVVQMALDYAAENGALVIASAGNESADRLAYPAGNEGVISVGAVDASGTHLGFSNSGETLQALAPGLQISAAVGEDGYGLFSGTSASAPLITGAIAATSTAFGIPLVDAYELILNNLDEAGAPGPDPYFGQGVLNMERVLNSRTTGIHDVAMASTYYQAASADAQVDQLLFTVENRGTAVVPGIELRVTTDYGQVPYVIGTLAPDQIETVALPIGTATDSLAVDAVVSIPANLTDAKPQNDRSAGRLTLLRGDEASPAPDQP